MSDSIAFQRFICPDCGHEHVKWAARCVQCLALKGLKLRKHPEIPKSVSETRWPLVKEKVQEEAVPLRQFIPRSAEAAQPDLPAECMEVDSSIPGPLPISDIEEASFIRDSTGLSPLDQVLGGGLVKASVVLLAAPPGSGKTSLTLRMLVNLGHRCLYATGEETREQVAATARRIEAVSSQLYVVAATNLSQILAHAYALRAQTVAIDSIQKMECDDVAGRAGTPTQVKACTQSLVKYAKQHATAIWIIGQVTGDGDIAGPKALEHEVDAVLELTQGAELQGHERILRCPSKNRFGATNVVGRFEQTSKGLVPIDEDGWHEPL